MEIIFVWLSILILLNIIQWSLKLQKELLLLQQSLGCSDWNGCWNAFDDARSDLVAEQEFIAFGTN